MPTPGPESTGSRRLLTIAEYAELGETEWGYTELIQGRILMSPSPTPQHNIAIFELASQLMPQLPGRFQAIHDIDIDLGLAPPDQPGFSRRPDLIVVDRDEVARVDVEGGILRSSEVAIVVEIVSPSSSRIDNVDKRGEYADAGIPQYWIVDIEKPISLVACHLTEEFGYVDDQSVTGTFHTDNPFPVTIDLDRLR